MSAAAVEKRTVKLSAGETFHFPDGTRVVAKKVLKSEEKEELSADETSVHEAKHAVVAWRRGLKVMYMTAIPGRTEDGLEYLGMTVTNGYDPVSAAAPHAHGHDGTVGDRANIEHHGDDIDAAASDARSVMAEVEAHIIAAANALSRSGSLSGGAFEAIMRMVEENQEDKYEIVVEIHPPNGKVERKEGAAAPENSELTIVDVTVRSDIKTDDSFTPEPDFAFAD